jgi:CheY-like chemotaxis protein
VAEKVWVAVVAAVVLGVIGSAAVWLFGVRGPDPLSWFSDLRALVFVFVSVAALGGVVKIVRGVADRRRRQRPRRRALVVEDNQGWRDLIEWTLREEGLDVVLVTQYSQALTEIGSTKEYNLLVADLNLEDIRDPGAAMSPQAEGTDVITRAFGKGIPTIVLTWHRHRVDVEDLVGRFRISCFLEKQMWNREEFRRCVRECIHTRS